MKKFWASFIAFWILAFITQKNLFIKFWKKVFEVILKIFIAILDVMLFIPRAIKHKKRYHEQLFFIESTIDAMSIEMNRMKIVARDNENILHEVVYKIRDLTKGLEKMELNVEALAAEVARVHTVHSSAATMLKKLTVELERVSAELAAKASETIDTKPLDDLIEKLKASTDALAGAVADSSNVIPTKEVILHADDPTVPTVQVNLPEVMPEVVTVSAETVVDSVDTTSPEPQVVVTVEPSTDATVTEDNVVADMIKTDEGLVDIVVTAPAEVAEAVSNEANVDVVAAVKEAFEATPEVVAEPVKTE